MAVLWWSKVIYPTKFHTAPYCGWYSLWGWLTYCGSHCFDLLVVYVTWGWSIPPQHPRLDELRMTLSMAIFDYDRVLRCTGLFLFLLLFQDLGGFSGWDVVVGSSRLNFCLISENGTGESTLKMTEQSMFIPEEGTTNVDSSPYSHNRK